MNEIDTQRKLMLHALNQKDYDAAVYHREKLEEAQRKKRRKKLKAQAETQTNSRAEQLKLRYDAIEQEFLAGTPIKELAKAYGLHTNTVRGQLIKRGHRIRLTKDEREKRDTEIVQKLKKGLSIAKVAKEYNLAEITVFKIAKKGAIGRC